jgi:phosphatidylinositol glycan class Q protein
MSHGGLTFAIVHLLDVLRIFTVHIHVCHMISRAVYQRFLRTVGSLWNLFHGKYESRSPLHSNTYASEGKRYNVLRNRIDSWNYDLDQLLFGTILFTLVAFLFPTVLIYYMLFASVRRPYFNN